MIAKGFTTAYGSKPFAIMKFADALAQRAQKATAGWLRRPTRNASRTAVQRRSPPRRDTPNLPRMGS